MTFKQLQGSILLATAVFLVGLDSAPAQLSDNESLLYVTPEELPVYVLDATPAFQLLSPAEKMYAHWMAQASWIGARITMSQVSAESPGLIELLLRMTSVDPVALHRSASKAGISADELKAFRTYAARVFSNLGNYLSFGDTKFIPRLPIEKFEILVDAAAAMASDGDRIAFLWSHYGEILYSLEAEERQLGLGDKGRSAYYTENMSEAEVELVNRFMVKQAMSPYNTRVTKDGKSGVVTIHVAAVNAREPVEHEFEGKHIRIAFGDHGETLAEVVRCLERALLYASNDHQRRMIRKYIDHFKGGDIDDHKDAMRSWIKDVGPVVETNIGFIESYRDPAGVRGEWEGLVAMVNKEQTRKFADLVAKAPEFIALLPWGPTFEKSTYHRPDFTSLDVMAFANCDIPAGINIPNYDDIRQNEGFKNVSLGNVLSARKPGTEPIPFIAAADQDLYRRWMGPAFEVQVGLHELLGHGSGRLFNETEPGKFDFDAKTTISPLTSKPITSWYGPGESWGSRFGSIAQTFEECRAEAVGLYLCLDKQVLEIFGHQEQEADDVVYVNWLLMARAGVEGLRLYNPATGEWGQAHMQARYALLNVMRRAGESLLQWAKDGDDEVLSLDRLQIATVGKKAVGDFLTKLMVFKATGDIEAAKAFYLDHTRVDEKDLKLRDLVIKKAKPRNLWVQPITDVTHAGEVILRAYPATIDGVINSFRDRFSWLLED